MGNTPSGNPQIIDSGQNGASVVVEKVTGVENSYGESYYYERQTITYCVNDRTCKASIKMMKQLGSDRAERFCISITDSDKVNFLSWRYWPYRFEMKVTREEDEHVEVYANTDVVQDTDILWVLATPTLLKTRPKTIYHEDAAKNPIKSTAKDGTITEMTINMYSVRGRDKQRGLVVIECKKKDVNQKPYMVIVSHYFVASYKTQLGVSVVAKIRGVDGFLELEGPIFHPAPSLFEMFNQVSKNRTWTPNLCRHCAERSKMENSNSVNYNYGVYYGNGNGSIYNYKKEDTHINQTEDPKKVQYPYIGDGYRNQGLLDNDDIGNWLNRNKASVAQFSNKGGPFPIQNQPKKSHFYHSEESAGDSFESGSGYKKVQYPYVGDGFRSPQSETSFLHSDWPWK